MPRTSHNHGLQDIIVGIDFSNLIRCIKAIKYGYGHVHEYQTIALIIFQALMHFINSYLPIVGNINDCLQVYVA